MILSRINKRSKQLIIRCLFTLSCCPEDHCQTFLSWTKFFETPFIHAFCEQYPCKFRKQDTVLTDSFWEVIQTYCIIIRQKVVLFLWKTFNRSFKPSSTSSRLYSSHSFAKKAFFSIFHTLPLQNLGHSSDSPYRGSLEFYKDSTRCSCDAIRHSLKSFAAHSAHFIFYNTALQKKYLY